jgi:diketogulonate reductase-like aldo/keto reductase
METQYLSFTVPQVIKIKYFILHITVQEQKGVQAISIGSRVFDCALLYNDNSYKSEQSVKKKYPQISEFCI